MTDKGKQVLSTTLDYLENYFLENSLEYSQKELEEMKKGSPTGLYRGSFIAYENAARKISETHKKLLKKWSHIK